MATIAPPVREQPSVEVLRQARELLSDERRWCKGTHAQDAKGREVPLSSPEAVAWCAEGAILRVRGEEEGWVPEISFLNQASLLADVVDFNDDPPTTHAEILAVFDRAIVEAEMLAVPA